MIDTAVIERELSRAEEVSLWPSDRVEEFFAGLSELEVKKLPYTWDFWARPKQLAPPGDWTYWLLLAGRGFGKMLSLDTPVPTPDGWKTMGDMQVGDRVFDENGRICNVTFVSVPEVPEVAHRLTFSDGTIIDACGEHQWVTWTHADRKAFLRSPYENSTAFPDDWVNWRLKRLTGYGMYLKREVVESAIELHSSGLSIRTVSRKLGISRNAITPHICAGHYIEPEPKVYADSPGPQIRTTNDIVETLTYGKRGDTNHCIPNARPLQLPEVDLSIDPYILGIWLGDGSKNEAAVTIGDEDAGEILKYMRNAGVVVTGERRKDDSACATYTVRMADDASLYVKLKALNLIKNKHVPAAYLRSSEGQRLALLQGLMDSDGGIEAASTVSFTNTNERLAESLYELVVSLGMRATISSRIPRLNGKACRRAYRVIFTPVLPVFKLERKLNALAFGGNQSLRKHHRMIKKAEVIRPSPMRCIAVDSPNRMYLASEAMVPTHNTRTVVEWAIEKARAMPKSRGAIVAATAADARDVLVEGESGFLAVSDPEFMPLYEPSKRRLTWPNGSVATIYSADKPDRLRGPQHHWAIADELAAWRYMKEAWDMLQFGLRLGDHPQCAIATTPRPLPIVKELLADDECLVTHGTTYENQTNLASSFFKKIIKKYEGTRLGRQELLAQILSDVPGALWNRGLLEDTRKIVYPPLYRIVVAVDPAASTGQTGIVVVGITKIGDDVHGFVIDDVTADEGATPAVWAGAAVAAYHKYEADAIVGEVNNGGAMVERVIRTVEGGKNVNYIEVRASRGKYTRAEPVSSIFERGHGHLVGYLGLLEDELCEWVPGNESPNRLDAMVWGFTELMIDDEREEPTKSAEPVVVRTADLFG
ncbi:MAG: hypothetical protein GY803_21975 [Chloroflexi bacterium]|nr:hypothetical protein [Chloroflexota bacterium]